MLHAGPSISWSSTISHAIDPLPTQSTNIYSRLSKQHVYMYQKHMYGG